MEEKIDAQRTGQDQRKSERMTTRVEERKNVGGGRAEVVA